jgi:hypothetical protein
MHEHVSLRLAQTSRLVDNTSILIVTSFTVRRLVNTKLSSSTLCRQVRRNIFTAGAAKLLCPGCTMLAILLCRVRCSPRAPSVHGLESGNSFQSTFCLHWPCYTLEKPVAKSQTTTSQLLPKCDSLSCSNNLQPHAESPHNGNRTWEAVHTEMEPR